MVDRAINYSDTYDHSLYYLMARYGIGISLFPAAALSFFLLLHYFFFFLYLVPFFSSVSLLANPSISFICHSPVSVSFPPNFCFLSLVVPRFPRTHHF